MHSCGSEHCHAFHSGRHHAQGLCTEALQKDLGLYAVMPTTLRRMCNSGNGSLSLSDQSVLQLSSLEYVCSCRHRSARI